MTLRESCGVTVAEPDVCVLHRNHFYVIEYKTARMSNAQKANDIL
jgi:hypothetical protein